MAAEMISLAVGPLDVNCYILWDSSAKEAFVIDPGGDGDEIKKAVDKRGLKAVYIVNTHGHFDHVGADGELKKAFGAHLAIHSKDAPLMKEAHEHGAFFGVTTPESPEPDMLLEDGEILKAGSIGLKVIHTPGHTKGGICLYSKDDGLLFTGDTLFAGSIGRTDFEGGSFEEIMRSITAKLLPLGDTVRVLPGHGPESTIGEEKRTNPFITGAMRG